MLNLQSAGARSGYLLERILAESVGALRGGGFFAWANYSGASALLEDPTFEVLLRSGDFRLIVGLDTITDLPALDKLQEIDDRHPLLDIELFLNSSKRLFHPKMIWFEFADHVTLLVGSGNLTMGGLRANWEAFIVTKVVGDEAGDDLATIDSWLADLAPELVPPSDSRARDIASRNIGNERSLRHARNPAPAPQVVDFVEAALVAEIPRSGSRWAQANFDVATYRGFFGAEPGTQRRIGLYHVSDEGELGALESRPSVEVASQNYRFELAAGRGIEYPVDGRPVGAFIRLASGEFLYSLALPGSNAHERLSHLLESRWQGSSNTVRRVSVAPQELKTAWPTAGLWDASVPAL